MKQALARGMSSSAQSWRFVAGLTAPPVSCEPLRGDANTDGWREAADVLASLLAEYGGYWEHLFAFLARSHPSRLTALVADGQLTPGKLKYAAEALGAIRDEDLAVSTLLPVLQEHASPLAREGAIHGLAHLGHRPDVREALATAALHDPSEGVREAANKVLSTFGGGFGCMAGTVREIDDIVAPLPPEDWDVFQ